MLSNIIILQGGFCIWKKNRTIELDESLQAEFDRDFENEFGPFDEWSGPLTQDEFFNHNKKIVEFCDNCGNVDYLPF